MGDELQEIIFAKGSGAKGVNAKFWISITEAVPTRPIIAVYHFVRRKYNIAAYQGKWTEEEDDLLSS